MKPAALRSKPGTITALQRQRIFGLAQTLSMTTDQLRESVGGSISRLSASQVSEAIERLSGQGLHHPPGQAPKECKRGGPGTVRIITPQQVQQIHRLAQSYWNLIDWQWETGSGGKPFYAWLKSTFKVDLVRDLATAQRAGECIYTLKTMLARTRNQSEPEAQAPGPGESS